MLTAYAYRTLLLHAKILRLGLIILWLVEKRERIKDISWKMSTTENMAVAAARRVREVMAN